MSTPVGLGTDLVEVARIGQSIQKHGEQFLSRCFTERERNESMRSGAERSHERFAARFAAKEAVLKAFGTGWSNGIGWTDIEITSDQEGAPAVTVSGRAAEIAAERGIRSWLVSMTHTAAHASATVVAMS